MRILGTIVEVAALSMLDAGQQTTLRHAVASQLVGNDHTRHILQALQQTLEESLGGFPIASLLNQNIEDDTILIHGTPEIMLNTRDSDEHFVEVPLIARPGTTAAKTISKTPAELLAPASHRLVGDNDAALSQKQLNIPQAEAEHMIQPYRVADDLRGEAMAVPKGRVAISCRQSRPLSPRAPTVVTVTMPVTANADFFRDVRERAALLAHLNDQRDFVFHQRHALRFLRRGQLAPVFRPTRVVGDIGLLRGGYFLALFL